MKKARFWIGILISLLALYLVFRQFDFKFKEVGQELATANYYLVAASVPVLIVFLVLRAYRWRVLFYPQQGLRIRNLLATINIGYLVSNILPARLGDVARAYLIGDTEPVSRAAAFSTVIAERVLDALCAAAGLLLVLPFAQKVPEELNWLIVAGYVVGALAVALVILFVLLARRRDWTLHLLDRVLLALHWPDREPVARFWTRLAERTHLRFLARMPWLDRPRLVGLAGSLIDGLSGITTLRQGPRLVVWSALIWTDITLFYWLILRAFDPAQSLAAALAVNSVTALGLAIPSAPGGWGIFEIAGQAAATMFGLGAVAGKAPFKATAFAVLAHIVIYVVYTIVGLISMAQQNLTYSEIQRRIEKSEPTA